MRRLFALLIPMSLALLVACAAPSPDSDAGKPEPVAAASSPADLQGAPATDVPAAISQRTKPAPPMSDPLPAQRAPDVQPPRSPPTSVRAPAATGKVDSSCRTDADCTVKNVGNCCGYYPACVNVNSPTDPQGVQAQCAKDGMASVCGFQEISGCQCVQGQCRAGSGAVTR